MIETREITIHQGPDRSEVPGRDEQVSARQAPAIVRNAGPGAEFAREEFFQAEIANDYTRRIYIHAIKRFLAWCQEQNLELLPIRPGDVGEYLQHLDAAIPTKKLHLTAVTFRNCCAAANE
jgi:integrase/recombinase XerD